MQTAISLVIIDSDKHSSNAIENFLRPFAEKIKVLGAAPDFQAGMRIIQNTPPTIVIMEARELTKAMEEISSLLARFPHISIFVTAHDKNPDWILRLIRAGASEYLTKPVVEADLADAIKKVARLHTQSSGHYSKPGRVISTYNPSGGMGTTTIAVNLAATLAARGEKVALIDLNLFCGDVHTFLDITPRYTLTSVTTNMARVDASFLMSVISQHPSGVHVLSGPANLEEAAGITAEQLQEIIAVLRNVFDYTIIDTGGPLPGCNLATFASSDHILYTTVLNLPALKNAKRYLAAMDREGVGDERVKLVINRHIPKDDIKVADAEKVLNTRAYLTVPNAYADVKASINKGMPLISCFPRSPVTKTIEDLASQLAVETSPVGWATTH